MKTKNLERRPLKSRQTKWAKFLSQWLLKKGVKPDQVSIASILFALLAGMFLFQIKSSSDIIMKIALYFSAAISIQLRLLCNLLDGMIAIEGGLKTKSGDIFNDLPDRLADSIILVCSGFSISRIPYAIHLGWLAALVAIMTAYIRLLGGTLGTTQYFSGPMAKQHRMATLTAACIFSSFAAFLGFEDYVMTLGLMLIIIGGIITVLRRVLRIIKDLQ